MPSRIIAAATIVLASLTLGAFAAPAPQAPTLPAAVSSAISPFDATLASPPASSPIVSPSSGGAASMNGTSSSTSGNRTCITFLYNITASANNTVYTTPEPLNQQAMIADSYIAAMASAPFAEPNSNGTRSVNGTYEIYMQYCEPTAGPTKPIVGTSGYWDVAPEGNTSYSFVEAATNAGYAVLSYDRLGVGNSSKPDGIQVVQIPLQIDIAIQIAASLRNNTMGLQRNFSSVVGVGHSFGSAQLVGAAGVSPSTFDALILTGFAANGTVQPLSSLLTFQSTIANTLANSTAGDTYDADWNTLSNSYLITASQSADQLGFFSYPNYTQAAIDLFTATKGTYTLGELMSMANIKAPSLYTGPVEVVTGARDAPFCATNCYDVPANYTSKLETAKALFPMVNSTSFETYVVPDTAHGINFHPTAPMAYAQIISFLGNHTL